MAFHLYNPLNFNDPVAYAVPGFVLLIITEFFLFYRKNTSSAMLFIEMPLPV